MNNSKNKKISVFDILISIVATFCCLYIYFFYDQLIDRGGILLNISLGKNIDIPIELTIGIIGILILLEATRRVIGLPLVIIAICFLLFSFFGRYAPEMISHGGLSLKRLVGFQWFDQEAIFGIPIGVSVDFIFLFVLLNAYNADELIKSIPKNSAEYNLDIVLYKKIKEIKPQNIQINQNIKNEKEYIDAFFQLIKLKINLETLPKKIEELE